MAISCKANAGRGDYFFVCNGTQIHRDMNEFSFESQILFIIIIKGQNDDFILTIFLVEGYQEDILFVSMD
jgi:hypothetical protein